MTKGGWLLVGSSQKTERPEKGEEGLCYKSTMQGSDSSWDRPIYDP